MIDCPKCGKEIRQTPVPYFNLVCDNCGCHTGDFSNVVKMLREEKT